MRQQAESKREPKNQKQQQQQLENLDLHSIQSQTEKQTEREGASGSGGGERWVVGREKGIGRRSKANMREERQSWVLHRLTKLRGRRHYQQGAHLHVCVSGGAATACVCVFDDKRMKKNLSRSHALTHTTHCLQEKAPAIDNGSPNGK